MTHVAILHAKKEKLEFKLLCLKQDLREFVSMPIISVNLGELNKEICQLREEIAEIRIEIEKIVLQIEVVE